MAEAASTPKVRAVIDTNVFVSGTISKTGDSAAVLEHLKRGTFQAITSRKHLYEIFRVLAYPRLRRKYRITERQRKRLVSQIYTRAVFVQPANKLAICRDPDDDLFIEMALLGKATHLVTGDPDLYDDPVIVRFLHSHKVEVVRLKEFLALF
ncbi:MAG: putative toxin-antitoxin system toxin component, PIN family [Anaerolineae bacterium]|jgi:putative PIN family toxin of toxin-antitoxin system|nr:putative toxin-antitoxin system toxin component, PIN family [Anaerolineae bacterium]